MSEKKLASVRLDTETIGKLKHIAWFNRSTYQDTAEAALIKFVKQWEKTNGEIPPADIKKALGEK